MQDAGVQQARDMAAALAWRTNSSQLPLQLTVTWQRQHTVGTTDRCNETAARVIADTGLWHQLHCRAKLLLLLRHSPAG